MFFKDQVRLVSPKIPQNKHQATHQSHSTCRCIQVFVKITLFWLEEKLEFLEKFRLRLLCNLNRLFFIVLAVGLMSSQKSIYCQCIGIRTPLFVLQREIQENHSKFTFDSRIFKISLRNIFTYHLALLFFTRQRRSLVDSTHQEFSSPFCVCCQSSLVLIRIWLFSVKVGHLTLLEKRVD